MTIKENEILKENERRKQFLFPKYNALTGEGSLLERFPFIIDDTHTIYLPISMKQYSILTQINEAGGLGKYSPSKTFLQDASLSLEQFRLKFLSDLNKLRRKHDFEFWAATKCYIKYKESQKIGLFFLDPHQRYIVYELEKQRLARVPIRLIVLKARQLGSSTVIDMYMLWMTTQVKENWNFVIAAHTQDASRVIKRMFELSIKKDGEFTVKNVDSPLVRRIVERGSIIRVGSAVKPESLRGEDIQMIHYSEVGSWKKTAELDPDDLIASISGSVHPLPDTCIVMESTAKSKGSFFYEEWDKAVKKESRFVPVFVAWWKVIRFQIPFKNDKEKLNYYHSLNDYGRFLWKLGATLEGIQWYFETKYQNNYKTQKMQNENPSTEEEAFTSIGERVFDIEYVENIKHTIKEPKFIGEITADAKKGENAFKNIRFIDNIQNGCLKIWDFPDTKTPISNRYLVAMDIGGRTDKADYSVIRVIDRYWRIEGGVDSFIATWRGHLDVDLAVWKAAQIAKAYNNALLVVERNTIDSKFQKTDGDHTYTVFNEIVPYYKNLYAEIDQQRIKEGLPAKYGFFTGSGSGKNTKTAIVDNLIALMREGGFIEHDRQFIIECDQFVYKKDGTLGAEEGKNNHDDVIMASGIGLLVSNRIPAPCNTSTISNIIDVSSIV